MPKLLTPPPDPRPAVAPLRPTRVSPLEILAMSTDALWSNKLRSGLTMLGVIIGIGSVIAISAVGQGVQKSTENRIQALGADVLQVSAGAARNGNVMQSIGSSSTLTWEDAKAIQAEAPSAQAVTAYLQSPGQVVYDQENVSTTIAGTDISYPIVRNTHPATGRYFTQAELDTQQQVAILGPTVQTELFGRTDPIGRTIRINGEQYEVIGVMEAKGSQGRIDRDDIIYIPLSAMSARIVGNNALAGTSINTIFVKTATQAEMSAAQFQISNILRLRHNIYPPMADDFRITNQAEIISTFTSIVGTMTVMVVAIAGISLVVGGIGIANIMLVSVVERTREIGIRKALGATNAAILQQFLAESVIIAAIGGGLGVGIGIGIAFGAATMFSFPFVVSGWAIAAGVGISVSVGLMAGVIPARNAARLDPIAALRSD